MLVRLWHCAPKRQGACVSVLVGGLENRFTVLLYGLNVGFAYRASGALGSNGLG